MTCSVVAKLPDGRHKSVKLAEVAETGRYEDLLGRPDVGSGGPHSHSVSDISGLVGLLDEKAALSHEHEYDPLGAADTALASALAADFGGSYTSLTDVPSTFAPSAHNQAISTITGLQAALDGKSATDHTHAGGSDPWTIVALSNDFTTTSNAVQNVTGLEFTPAANGRYMFEAVLGVRTATTTVNPRVGLAWATGMTDGVAQIDESQSATARLMSNGNINASLLVAVGGLPNNSQTWPVTVWGWVKAGATPSGNVRVTLQSETNGTTVRVTANSYLRYRTY